MTNDVKLRLQMPYSEKPGKYFSFRLHKGLQNERSEYRMPPKVLFLSGVQGSFQNLQRILFKNRVIDRYHQWIFEDGHVVILGNCLTRDEQGIACLWLIYSLEERAMRAGGYMHFILGKHEIMNLNGDWRYIHPKYAIPVNEKTAITALYDGNNALWHWLLTKNIMEKIGDILVVHGGISPEINRFPYSVTEINQLARLCYPFTMQPFEDPLQRLIFNSEQSPFCYKGYYQETASEEQVDATLAHFGVCTIVTGHTMTETINTYFNEKVININTNHASGNSKGLLIKKDKDYRIDINGMRERLM